MAATATEEQKTQAAAHAVGLLNELEATLKGWVLKVNEEQVDRWLDPVYTWLDEEH